jgi:hypothetical protein
MSYKTVNVRAIRSKQTGEVYLSSTDLLEVLDRDLEGTGDYENDPVPRNTANYVAEFMKKLTTELQMREVRWQEDQNKPVRLI